MGRVELSLNHSTNLTPSSSASGSGRATSRLIGHVRLHGIDAVSPTIADTLSHGPEKRGNQRNLSLDGEELKRVPDLNLAQTKFVNSHSY